MSFPFEAVYKKAAHAVLQTGIPPNGDLEPMAFVVKIEEDKEISFYAMPPIGRYFGRPNGKEILGNKIRFLIEESNRLFPEIPVGVVIISEAYMLETELTDDETVNEKTRKVGSSISSHENSIEVVIITIQTLTQSCAGSLRILPGRKLEFMPFKGIPTHSYGSFTNNPDLPT